MKFNNPEVLPSGSSAAEARFQVIINSQLSDERVLLVVLGDSAASKKLKDDAVRLTGTGKVQGVVWANNPSEIKSSVDALKTCSGVPKPDLNAPDRAFSLSINKRITAVIGSSEPQPDETRIENALAAADGDCQ